MIRNFTDDTIRVRKANGDLVLESDEYGVDLAVWHDEERMGRLHISPAEVMFLIDFLEKALDKWDKREI